MKDTNGCAQFAAQLSVNHPCPRWLLRTLRIAMRWIAPAAILTIFVYGLL